MYATYGTYTHSAANYNAVNLTRMQQIPQYSDRRKRFAYLYRLHLRGELLADTQAGIHSLIEALIQAYADNGKDWTLYHDDNTPTRHRLIQNHDDALSDVQVEHRSWPVGDPAEYATGRVFHIIMRQLVAAAESQILEYWETIRYIGDCGPTLKPVRLPLGTAIIQTVSAKSPAMMVQHGRVVAFQGWPDLYVPNSYLPNYLTKVDLHYLKPRYSGRQYTHYGIEWMYHHVLPEFTVVHPGLLP